MKRAMVPTIGATYTALIIGMDDHEYVFTIIGKVLQEYGIEIGEHWPNKVMPNKTLARIPASCNMVIVLSDYIQARDAENVECIKRMAKVKGHFFLRSAHFKSQIAHRLDAMGFVSRGKILEKPNLHLVSRKEIGKIHEMDRMAFTTECMKAEEKKEEPKEIKVENKYMAVVPEVWEEQVKLLEALCLKMDVNPEKVRVEFMYSNGSLDVTKQEETKVSKNLR